jgi:TPR repeat protein
MATRTRKPDWSHVLARLKRGVIAGDVASIRDLGLTLADGIQDRNGRCIVRRNSAYSVRLLRRAAESGDCGAMGSLGYAYDVGQGIRGDKARALEWYRRAVKMGNQVAAANIATVYRDKGNLGLAHRWLLRAVKMGDGDAAVTAGYGYLYGIGVRADISSARRMFRRALRGRDTSPYGREEALYNLAIAHVDSGNPSRAIPFLERANNDGDYPEAASLLAQIEVAAEMRPCRCRRHLNKHIRGHAECPQHSFAATNAGLGAPRSGR